MKLSLEIRFYNTTKQLLDLLHLLIIMDRDYITEPKRQNSLLLLNKGFYNKVVLFLHEVLITYPNVAVFESLRTQERQDWLYSKGRTRPGPIVTNTLQSNHSDGKAVDLVFMINGQPSRQGPYKELGDIAKKYEIEWGGNRKQKDLAHFEDNGKPLSINNIIMSFYKEIYKKENPQGGKVIAEPDGALSRLKNADGSINIEELVYFICIGLERVKNAK